jgi:RNA polymerase sigma-32 factor
VRFGVPLDDLVSEGMVGLVTAARRYDPERGVRLSAYAAYWIRMKLRRFTLHNRRMVRPPSTRRGRAVMASLANVEHQLSQAQGADPDRETVAQHLGASPSEVEEMRLALRGRDAVLSGGDTQESGIALVSEEPSPEALAETHEREAQAKALLTRALERLKPRERAVLQLRFLADEAPSFSAIGADLGVSRERVRQIEARGYEKLREAVLGSVA